MSACELTKDPKPRVKEGVTLFGSDGCLKHTGVFFPRPQTLQNTKLNVIVWLHGMDVEEIKPLFDENGSKVRQAVLDSQKDVVLVAPFLGHKWVTLEDPKPGDKVVRKDGKVKVVHGSLGLGKLGQGVGMQQYLEEVLKALANYQKTVSGNPDAAPPNLQIEKLVLACHSGGGVLMREATDTLGDFKKNGILKECWGFDCLYAPVNPWYTWASTLTSATLFFYYGQGTSSGVAGIPVEFWRKVYGSPQEPVKTPLKHVRLAPAVMGVEDDSVAFQSVDALKAKSKPSNRYEEIRKQVDPWLDNTSKYWDILFNAAYDHYKVASALFSPRIKVLF
jgi:hypothetical protein